MRDLRYAFRSLARTPVFAVTAVVILSLSVGAATTVFTLLHALVGADAGRMTQAILRDGLIVTAIGISIGLAGAIASVPLIGRLLVNTSPYDPMAIGLACLLLFLVTSVASMIPAMRAGRVEPLAELRRD